MFWLSVGAAGIGTVEVGNAGLFAAGAGSAAAFQQMTSDEVCETKCKKPAK